MQQVYARLHFRDHNGKIVEYFNDVRDSFHAGISRAKSGFSTRNATRCKPLQMLLGVLYFQCEMVLFGKILTKEW